MKKTILFITVLTLLSCKDNESQYDLPTFTSNSSIDEVWEPIQAIVETKDYSIVYSESGGSMSHPAMLDHKMFCLKDNVWSKIEIKVGITEIDTLFSNLDGDIVDKEIKLQKTCRKEEAEKFLASVIDLGLFKLSEETELLEQCKKIRTDHEIPEYSDAGGIVFYIIDSNKKVRRLFYSVPTMMKNDCPNMKEWENIVALSDLFEKEWYVKKHY